MKCKVKAIIFDAGGTLLCPARPVGETYAKFAKAGSVKLSAAATETAFLQAFKSSTPRSRDLVPRDGNDRAWWKQVVKLSLPENAFADQASFETFFEAVYLYFAKPEAWEIYPEVMEVLEELRDYPVELAVLSNWDSRLNGVLDGLGLGEFLPRRFISAELGWEKPDPAIYRHVADIMRVPAGALLSVGDHARNDVEAPRKAGWQALQIERPKHDLWSVIHLLKNR
jgi:putative hydrolase of the HAD superfamily